jgi:hypothetical protein
MTSSSRMFVLALLGSALDAGKSTRMVISGRCVFRRSMPTIPSQAQ